MTIIGIPITKSMNSDTKGTLKTIKYIEELGIQAVWMTTGPGHAGPFINMDALTVFSASSVQTDQILMGTSIVPILPRHPIVVAQQVQVLDELSEGRFRLGIGTGHKKTMETSIGHPFNSPLAQLSEYLQILKTLFKKGSVSFNGKFYQAEVEMPSPINVPVMASALGPKSFELCGSTADGAISWLCPWQYLKNVALPQMEAGAKSANRLVPPLIAHVPILAGATIEQTREAMREHVSTNPKNAEFANMFRAAGLDEVDNGEWSDSMIDAVALYGDQDQIIEGLKRLQSIGASEIIASPIPFGDNIQASIKYTLQVVAKGQEIIDIN